MKRKYLDASNWTWLEDYTYHYEYIQDEWSGYLSVVEVGKVKHPLKVHYGDVEVCLCDDGYKGIIFLPDNEYWCVSAVYNEKGEIVEWYFDMTKENGVDEKGLPYFEDLYLDIAIAPDFTVRILDEDELQEALEKNVITQKDYDLAYKTCHYLLENIVPNKKFLTDFLKKYLK